jgi:23S rRNA pseudouridine1911/1915/1917 synthase
MAFHKIEKNNNRSFEKSIKERKIEVIKTLKVQKEAPLLEFLYQRIPTEPRTTVKRYLTNHQILVNGSCLTQYNFALCKNDVVEITKRPNQVVKEEKTDLDIIYEDKDFVVINKPAGLLSVESDNVKQNTAYRMVETYIRKKDKAARIYQVHRIDKETSGVLIFVKSEAFRNLLFEKWNEWVKKREYLAICEGIFDKKQGTVKSYLQEDIHHLMHSSLDKKGQLSVTHYQVIKENTKFSYVDVVIDSGRKNQIRVHLGEMGHKIIGDEKYEATSNPIGRLGLHAYKLELIHPITKKQLSFTAKIPSEFNRFFK